MNYLAHLLLSGERAEVRLGGILGDFYKGPIEQLPLSPGVSLGVWLHRKIDAHSDQHLEIKQCVSLLGPPLRRTGGIVIDIAFDHFLAKHWSLYCQQDLLSYSQDSYTIMAAAEPPLPPAFVRFRERAASHDLLSSYRHLATIETVLERVAQRLSQPQRMQGAFQKLVDNYDEIEHYFLTVFPQLQAFSQQQLEAQHG